MTTLRRTIVTSASAGFGVLVAIALLGLLAYWVSTRPVRQAEWNTKAIVAKFDHTDAEGESNPKTLVFYYILENTTDSDYRLPSKDQLEILPRLGQKGSLTSGSGVVSVDEDASFIPARHHRMFPIHFKYPLVAGFAQHQDYKDLGYVPVDPEAESISMRRRRSQEFVTSELTNLKGFAIFDQVNRYEIDFSDGWTAFKKR